MKWEEMTTGQKVITAVGLVCGLAYFGLSLLNIFEILYTPRPALYPLSSVLWVSLGITQTNRKYANFYYFLGAGYGLLALLYFVFR